MPSQPAKSIAMRPSSQSIDSEAPSFMGKSLANLPSELLAQVVAHIETARILLHLSLTCRRLRRFVERDGFRVFVQTRFPYIQSFYSLHGSSFWRDAAHGLTTLQRNWDRKAFIARRIKHDPETHYDGPGQRTHRRSRQTMGFIPVIDSYETWYGGDWDSRKEVVAWGAGAGLVMRVTTMGNKAEDMWGTGTDTRKLPRCLDVHGHNIDWTVYNETNVRDGRDDITYLNLLPQQILGDPEQVIIGRASGGLSRVSLCPNLSNDQAEVVAAYETGCRSVRSAARNASNQQLLAACLSDSAIALYPLDTPHRQVKPVGEVSAVPAKASERTWSSHFLNHNRLAVGFGPSEKPIQVYDIGCGQLTDKNVRSLALSDTEAGASIDGPDMVHLLTTSVYSLAPIPTCSLAGGGDGEVFLSGAYDGLTRLHDLRAPCATVATFRDPVDTFSPIYSLLPIGSERFIAGSSRHSIIKVFDLRIPGGKLYHAAEVDPCAPGKYDPSKKKPKQRNLIECCGYHHEAKYNRRDWNVFLEVPARRRRPDSPVYALSRPSQCSPRFFAGVENSILQLDVVSIMDQYPDPLFKHGPAKRNDRGDVPRKWDPYGDAIPMPMYEHTFGAVNLLKQKAEVEYAEPSIDPGLDERWSTSPQDFMRRGVDFSRTLF